MAWRTVIAAPYLFLITDIISWYIIKIYHPFAWVTIGAGAGMMNGVSNGGSAFSPVLMGFFISISGSYVGGLMFLVCLAVFAACCAAVLAYQKY